MRCEAICDAVYLIETQVECDFQEEQHVAADSVGGLTVKARQKTSPQGEEKWEATRYPDKNLESSYMQR